MAKTDDMLSSDEKDTSPQTVVLGSPEFNAAVALAVAQTLAAMPPAAPATVSVVQAPSNVPKTSLASNIERRDEVTVRFRRWTQHRNTAYQKNQEAGFPAKEAEDLRERGVAIIVHAHPAVIGGATRNAA